MRAFLVTCATLGLFLSGSAEAITRPVALAPSPPPPAPDRLVELARIELAPPYAATPTSTPSLAFSPGAEVVYATSRSHLFVVSAADGTALDVRELAAPGQQPSSGFGLALADAPGAPLLAAWNAQPPTLQVLSLEDPAHPVARHDLAWGERIVDVLPLPGSAVVAVLTKDLRLIDLAGGAHLSILPPAGLSPSWGPMAVGGSSGRPLLAVKQQAYVAGVRRSFLIVYDVTDPAAPALLAQWEPSASPYLLAIDARGEIVTSCAQFGPCEIRSTEGGALLSVVSTPGAVRDVALAEGGGGRVLAVSGPSSVQLVDLAEPASPGAPTVVEAGMTLPYLYGLSEHLAPSSTEPLLAVAAVGEGSVLVVDVRTGAVISRWDAGGPRPVAARLGEGPGGRRTAAIVSLRMAGDEVFVIGGASQLDLLDLGNPAAPVVAGRLVRTNPLSIERFATLDRGLAVAADPGTNALVLLQLDDGAVLHATGFFQRFGRVDEAETLFARGRTVLAISPSEWEVFDVSRGQLVSRTRGTTAFREEVFRGGLLPDGTAVVLTSSRLLTELPDGRQGSLDLPPLPAVAVELALSPSGRRALVSRLSFWPGEAGATLVSLDDPAAPTVVWDGLPEVASATFLEDEDRIFATFGLFGGWFTAGLFDAATGEPLGPPSEQIDVFYYHGLGTSFGAAGAARAVLWRWTWLGWETLLLDVGGTTPHVIEVLPEFVAGPAYLARSGGGWYEFHNDPWEGPSEILVGLPDGAQTRAWELPDRRTWHSPRAVHPGVLAAVEQIAGRGVAISVWADPSAVRARPVVRGAAPPGRGALR